MNKDKFIKLTLEGADGKPLARTPTQRQAMREAYNALVTSAINVQAAYDAMLQEGDLTIEQRAVSACVMENLGKFVKPFAEALEAEAQP